jgi:hypothetical protein
MKYRWMIAATVLLAASLGAAQEMKCPMHDQHSQQPAATCCHGKEADHAGDVDTRGDEAMGFMHTKTTHHFLLKEDGGVIQVTADDAQDGESIRAIRAHLGHIATAFAAGDFDIPMFVHDQTPPGVGEMKRLRSEIHYSFEELERGGRVVIQTKDAGARTAIHQFLRFQIEEHRTGDPEAVQ